MLQYDLASARTIWISEAKTKKECEKHEATDFLKHQDPQGRFADFHALRHTFFTNLCRANVAPKTAQASAPNRHIRPTMNTYSHVDI